MSPFTSRAFPRTRTGTKTFSEFVVFSGTTPRITRPAPARCTFIPLACENPGTMFTELTSSAPKAAATSSIRPREASPAAYMSGSEPSAGGAGDADAYGAASIATHSGSGGGGQGNRPGSGGLGSNLAVTDGRSAMSRIHSWAVLASGRERQYSNSLAIAEI